MLKAGGPWIFDNEIAFLEGSYENGDILEVRDFDGYSLGKGFINDAFQDPHPHDDPEQRPGDK